MGHWSSVYITSDRKSRNPDRKPEEKHQKRQVFAFLEKQVFVITRRQVPRQSEAGVCRYPKAVLSELRSQKLIRVS
jgi:hypothetical protein